MRWTRWPKAIKSKSNFPKQDKPLYPHEIRGDPAFWEKYPRRIVKGCPPARSNGKIIAKHRVPPRKLQPEEREIFLQWLQDYDFKGNYTRLLTGNNQGTYVFMDKEDAVIFKMFWGR